ncbi:hypothetical protein IHE45_05G108200 [Dioscorea alata]|uniref:Uncharacterized protein n=1 Tax=Dioscorea alata TaxID=55571 RepID=A0ACB7W4B7_DIOAL|nr:hypothetical protein IHE45_05G108200 [Dioscorea alata]
MDLIFGQHIKCLRELIHIIQEALWFEEGWQLLCRTKKERKES